MSKVWVTSDNHFFHKNIIEHSNRPFNSLEQMHPAMIDNINKVVHQEDTLYFLGDIALTSKAYQVYNLIDRINCNRIRIVRGNHDKWAMGDTFGTVHRKVEWIKDYFELKGFSRFIVMSHYPFSTWNRSHYGSLNLHGHCHGGKDIENVGTGRYDVGVDANGHNYRPILINDIIRKKDNENVSL
jgi:calcineurin-like phosphoesterase family protein